MQTAPSINPLWGFPDEGRQAHRVHLPKTGSGPMPKPPENAVTSIQLKPSHNTRSTRTNGGWVQEVELTGWPQLPK